MSRLFVLAFENDQKKESYKKYFLPTVEDYNFMIDGRNFFHQSVKNDKRTDEYIKTASV